MRISTKGRGIIKAQQGTVARPNPKENKDNPDRVNVQQQGFRGANVNMKDANVGIPIANMFTLYVNVNQGGLQHFSLNKGSNQKWIASTLSNS